MKKVNPELFNTAGRVGRKPSVLTQKLCALSVGDVVEVVVEDFKFRITSRADSYFQTLGRNHGMRFSYKTIEEGKKWILKRVK